MATTLEQQLDGLIAEHGLSSIALTRIVMDDGTHFWGVCANASGISGSNRGLCDGTVEAELAAALDNLNEKRTRAVVVPDLAPMEQAA